MSESRLPLDSAAKSARCGTVAATFRTAIDGTVWSVSSPIGQLTLVLEGGCLVFSATTPEREAVLEATDVGPLADGAWHGVALVVDGQGTRLFVDGYQAFAGTVTSFLADLGPDVQWAVGSEAVEVRDASCVAEVWGPRHILAAAPEAAPLIQFATNRLSDYDAESVSALGSGTIEVRYRVRGRGQGGTLLAAAAGSDEQLRVRVEGHQICFEVRGREHRWRTFSAAGDWADGAWHDLAIRVGQGAVDLYVDGYRRSHEPGSAFFADCDEVDSVVVGQDTAGSRFWGEASRAAIYTAPLNDHQLKRRSSVPPWRTDALFDRGYGGAASYRIPSLLLAPGGTLLAGADQRTASPNDSPNHINFVVRRSADSGLTWGNLQTVIASYGSGDTGASVIDSCPVADHVAGRVVVVIDHFPGGIGQPNNGVGVGVDAEGRPLLHDDAGRVFRWRDDGAVIAEDGATTEFTVDERGEVSRGAEAVGNVYAEQGPLQTARTCFLLVTHSDDDGATWSPPRHINHQVKEPWMRFCGTAPGTGIQLRHGAHAGRLLVPIYFEGDHLKRVSTACIISDDHGLTWRRGGSPNDERHMPDGQIIDSRTHDRDDASLHESTVAELGDGTVLMLMRNQHPSGRLLACRSTDGADTWGEVTVVEEIPEIFCQPNMITLDDGSLLFCNASQMLPYRGNGVLRRSYDGGRTWPWSRTINPGHHVYQSMAQLPDGTIALLWENEWQGLYLTRVTKDGLGLL